MLNNALCLTNTPYKISTSYDYSNCDCYNKIVHFPSYDYIYSDITISDFIINVSIH